MIPPPAMSLSASGITSRMSPPARSIPPGRRPPCGPISSRRSPLPRTAFFTEWYPSRGYNFNITNNTAYDQYFVYGRNIFTNISRLVDELFDQYISRRGAVNPIFAQYCNGTTVTCGAFPSGGTVALANNGYTPLGILRYYYGDDIVIDTATVQRRITSSYPGSPLTVGSRGRMSAPSAPGSTASAAIIRPFPPSAPPAIPTMPKCSARCRPSSASSI